ncbi:zinc-binding alcohol dehydrogenase family protein, partial [Mycobacterium tuberculosis]|nr:zinc-binding alcohol dehydrogenase family protein [Mycobacterium tuberculosis]
SLTFAEAAALPLTALTAWETLFDRLDVAKPVPGAAKVVLIIGGAGGVGSIAVQLVRQLTDLTVIATASRPETRQWAAELGA